MSRFLEAAALGLLLVAATRHALVPPPVVEGRLPSFEFSPGRSWHYARVLARSPRPPGSAGHEAARAWLGRVLTAINADTLTQEALQLSPDGSKAAFIRNLAGRLPGRIGAPAVLLVAHYDSHAATPGAGDDASGTAIVLEVMRALRAGPPLEHDVIALFTDAEEEGMLGAAAFARDHPWRGEVGVVINVEARGAGGRSLMFETGSANLGTVAAYSEEVQGPTASSLFYALYQLLPNDTDFTRLRALGVPGLNLAFIGDVAAYHTPLDTIGRLDRRTLAQQGRAVLELARRFALRGPPADTAGGGSASFFSTPGLGLVWWPLAYRWSLLAAATLLVGAALGFGLHRRRLRAGQVALALAGALLVTALATAAALGLRLGLGHLAEGRWGVDALGRHPALALAPLSLALGVAIGLLRLLRRWVSADEVAAGTAVIWLTAATAVTRLLPAGSYLFLVPAMGAGAGLLLRAVLAPETGGPWARWLATLALVPVVVPLLPLGYLGLGTGYLPTGATAALATLSAWLLAPLVAEIEPRPWWAAPAAALVGAAGLSIWAVQGAHHSAAWPRPENRTVMRAADSANLGIERIESANAAALDPGAVRLRIRAPAATHRLALALPTPPRSARLGGLDLPVDAAEGKGGWRFTIVGPPDSGIVLDLATGRPGEELEIGARVPGLPPGTERPAGTMPIGPGDATVWVRRVVLE